MWIYIYLLKKIAIYIKKFLEKIETCIIYILKKIETCVIYILKKIATWIAMCIVKIIECMIKILGYMIKILDYYEKISDYIRKTPEYIKKTPEYIKKILVYIQKIIKFIKKSPRWFVDKLENCIEDFIHFFGRILKPYVDCYKDRSQREDNNFLGLFKIFGIIILIIIGNYVSVIACKFAIWGGAVFYFFKVRGGFRNLIRSTYLTPYVVIREFIPALFIFSRAVFLYLRENKKEWRKAKNKIIFLQNSILIVAENERNYSARWLFYDTGINNWVTFFTSIFFNYWCWYLLAILLDFCCYACFGFIIFPWNDWD